MWDMGWKGRCTSSGIRRHAVWHKSNGLLEDPTASAISVHVRKTLSKFGTLLLDYTESHQKETALRISHYFPSIPFLLNKIPFTLLFSIHPACETRSIHSLFYLMTLTTPDKEWSFSLRIFLHFSVALSFLASGCVRRVTREWTGKLTARTLVMNAG